MLKFYNYDIVFAEIPDELTLAVNLTNCPNQCPGCHSPHLWQDIGEVLNQESLDSIVETYLDNVTCVCFMGGDRTYKEVEALAEHVHSRFNKKTAWYSGKDEIPKDIDLKNFDYIKTGSYKQELGGLKNPNTNQRLYRISPNKDLQDITSRFHK